jgi:hypothetical protein
LKYRYYSKENLLKLDDRELSFGICNNLLDSAFNILQHPFELLRNENDYFSRRKSIEEFDLLASFLSTVTAIELLMKALVALKDWKNLFSNKNKICRKSLIDGDFKSINFENCIAAIEGSHGIKIYTRTKDRIEVIRIMRNKITHYYMDFSKEEMLSHIAYGLDIFIETYRSYLKEQVYDDDDRTEGFEEDLSDIHQFVEARIESSKTKEGSIYKLSDELNSECQNCWTISLALTETKEIKCLYCGKNTDIEEYAKLHADDNTEITTCPKCQKKTVITRRGNNPRCIACGTN